MKDIIQDTQTNKSTGTSSLPNKIVKQDKDVISFPRSELINKSFSKGIFPSALKIAKVVPVFKSESRLLRNSYVPISLLSNLSKIIEKLMHKRLSKFLEQERCFYNLQYDFHVNCFTNNALMWNIENIQTHLNDGKYFAWVFVDLKKA